MSAYARDKRSKENIEVYSIDETYTKAESDGRFQPIKYYRGADFENNVIISSGDAAWEYVSRLEVWGNKDKFDPLGGDKEVLVLPRLTDFTYPKDNNDYWMSYKGIDFAWQMDTEHVEDNIRNIELWIFTKFHNHGISGSTTVRGFVNLITDYPVGIRQIA